MLTTTKSYKIIGILVLLTLVSIINYYFQINKPTTRVQQLIQKKEYIFKKETLHVSEECLKEWAPLDEDTYFRRNLAFYYSDKQTVKFYLERRPNRFSKLNATIKIELKFKNSLLKKQHILNVVKYKTIQQHETYSFESIEASFNLNELFDDIELFQAFITHRKATTTAIDLVIKQFKPDKKLKKHSIVCSKIYRFFHSENAKQFKWWIEMNKIHGYEKVVIYNNSIENSNDLNLMFEQYKDFVEVVQFKCIPNLIEIDKKNKSFLQSFEEIRKLYKKYDLLYADHFELVVLNECYLQNMDKYNFITANSYEETIIPQYLSHLHKIQPDFISDSKNFVEKTQLKCYYENNKTEKNIKTYLEKLNQDLNLTSDASYQFGIGIYLKNKAIDDFFINLGKLLLYIDTFNLDLNGTYHLNAREKSDKVFVPPNNELLGFKVTINNDNEYKYAKYLYDLYVKKIKPFYKTNSGLLSHISDGINRLFYLTDSPNTQNNGKTIRNTVANEPIIINAKKIPLEHGFVSDFRKEYILNSEIKTISEIHFDLNYFLCYYLPILNKNNIYPVF